MNLILSIIISLAFWGGDQKCREDSDKSSPVNLFPPVYEGSISHETAHSLGFWTPREISALTEPRHLEYDELLGLRNDTRNMMQENTIYVFVSRSEFEDDVSHLVPQMKVDKC